MRLVRIALAHVNTTVGATKSNVDRAIAVARAASADGATIVVMPEQTIGGYMQEDLVQWRAFVDAQWRELERFAAETQAVGSVLAIGCTVAQGAQLYNSAVLVHRGQILGVVPKEKLPTYNVFYEGRTMAHGSPGLRGAIGDVPFGDLVFDFDFGAIALEMCEDAWSPEGPMRRRCFAGAEIVLNLSASPYRVGITDTRREMIATRSGDNQCVVAYANLVGGNDGLVFDGGGLVAQNGRVVLEAPRFREGFSATTIDLDRTRRLRLENTTWRTDEQQFGRTVVTKIASSPSPSREKLVYPAPPGSSFFLPGAEAPVSARVSFCEDLLDALSLGLGDYFEKTGAFKRIGVALSGGRDSLLALFIAHRYVSRKFGSEGKAKIAQKSAEILRAFYMPSRFSSSETRAAATATAKELGVPLVVSSIDEAFERELASMKEMLQPGEELTQLARQNVQACVCVD